MVDIVFLFSQYELLMRTAQYLSTLDLLNVGLTCSCLRALVLQSKQVFDRLKRVALCDGLGLRMRQEFRGFYKSRPPIYGFHGPETDEEIEVRLFNLKCDAANAFPCQK